MDKRTFLRLSTASAGAAFFSGCTSTEFRQIVLEDKTQIVHSGPFPYTAEERKASQVARALFSSPRYADAGVAQQQVLRAQEIFRDKLAVFKRARVKAIPVEYAGPLSVATGDLMHELAVLGEQPTSRAKPIVRSMKGTVVTVPPRTTVEFNQRGFCLDSTLAVPGKGEKYVLRHVSTMIDPELLPLYYAIHEYAQREPRARRGLQALTWALRDAGTRSPYAAKIPTPYLRLMGDAMPGGEELFVRHHNAKLAANTNALGDLLRDITTVRGSDGRNKNISDLVKNWDAADDRALAANDANAEATLNRLHQLKVPGEIPDDDSDFSMLAPNVAAHAVGTAPLTPKITIANDSDQPFEFDTKQFFAESQRTAQRVGLGAPTQLSQGGSGISNSDVMRQIVQDIRTELRDFTLENVHRFARTYLDTRRFAAVAPLINSTPILGGLLQLSNLITARDWLTGEELGCAEQVLAAVGTVPGAGAFLQLVGGARRAGAIRALANSAYAERLISGVQRTQIAREIGDWLTSDTVAGANGLLPNNAIGNRISQVLTGGCSRSWGA